MRKTIVSVALGATLALFANFASADEYGNDIDGKPSAGAMAFDLLVVRPVSLVATVLGTGLFFLSVPLSIIQGEPPGDPAKKLVVEPARYTFDRPLGEMQ